MGGQRKLHTLKHSLFPTLPHGPSVDRVSEGCFSAQLLQQQHRRDRATPQPLEPEAQKERDPRDTTNLSAVNGVAAPRDPQSMWALSPS